MDGMTLSSRHRIPNSSPGGLRPSTLPRIVVSTAAFHARVPSLVPGLGGLKETQMFLSHSLVKLSIVGNLRDMDMERQTDRQTDGRTDCHNLTPRYVKSDVYRRQILSKVDHRTERVKYL